MINYDNKRFRHIDASSNSQLDESTIFQYTQVNNVISATYSGGSIEKGQLLGFVLANGNIDMRYHQVTKDGQIRTGTCLSTPEILENGKIRLYEYWQWTSGDKTKGTSILEEL